MGCNKVVYQVHEDDSKLLILWLDCGQILMDFLFHFLGGIRIQVFPIMKNGIM
jgi:hypothetical protein